MPIDFSFCGDDYKMAVFGGQDRRFLAVNWLIAVV